MFWSLPKELLADPQQLNSYSYARNNPIVGSDPDGLAVVTVGGTNFWGGGAELNNETLNQNIAKSFPDQKVLSFKWDGADNTKTRTEGANQLNSFINDKFKDLPANEPLNIVCHSHGCGLAALYTQQKDAKQTHNLISLGAPVLYDYLFNENKIDSHTNVYSNKDIVQKYAGNQLTSAGLIGAALFGKLGGRIGDYIGWGEFGFAGRQVPGADYNQNATEFSSYFRRINNHLTLYSDSRVWDKYIADFIKN